MFRLAFCVSFLVFTGCGGVNGQTLGQQGDSRTVPLFNEAAVSSALSAEFKQGPLSAVELTGDPTLLPLVEVQVVNQRLGIRLTDKAMKIKPGSIKATVTVPRLQTLFAHEAATISAFALEGSTLIGIDADGASSVRVAGASAASIAVNVTDASTVTIGGLTRGELRAAGGGGSKVTVDDVEGANAWLQLSGSSTATLSGAVSTITLVAEKGSTVDASRLKSKAARLTAESKSGITAYATEEVAGMASEVSTITVLGQPASRAVAFDDSSTVKFQ